MKSPAVLTCHVCLLCSAHPHWCLDLLVSAGAASYENRRVCATVYVHLFPGRGLMRTCLLVSVHMCIVGCVPVCEPGVYGNKCVCVRVRVYTVLTYVLLSVTGHLFQGRV